MIWISVLLREDEKNALRTLADMEYRKVVVRGALDPAQEVAIINQEYHGQVGAHIMTPLRIAGTDKVVLVDRGWIPAEDMAPEIWGAFSQPGIIEITGMIRKGEAKRGFGMLPTPTLSPGQNRQTAWLFVNIDQLSQQMGISLLPIYIQQTPDHSRVGLPYPTEPEFDLTEGPHQGYAIQWFTFAAIAILGTPLYINREEQRQRRKK